MPWVTQFRASLPTSFGKGVPFCAPQQSGRFCRSLTTPHLALLLLSCHPDRAPPSGATRDPLLDDPAPPPPILADHSALGRHPERSEGSLFDPNLRSGARSDGRCA